MSSGQAQRLEREIASLGERFAEAARAVVAASLGRAVERFLEERAAWVGGLEPGTARALREALGAAVERSADAVASRLRDPDLWLDPLVAREAIGARTEVWGGLLPGWVIELARRLGRPSAERVLRPGELDDLNNRVWLALVNAAEPVAAVLAEFGVDRAELGGTGPAFRPRSLRDLDPGGRLRPLWRRYVALYARYRDLGGNGSARDP
ncbi:MAG TPA: hypothetical protein VNO79_09015 [Actinomycetota bacterium]|nr:hypothetical protein [Actinomycetota bacterium]